MPRDKDRKRLIRQRMSRTGQRYTEARAVILNDGGDAPGLLTAAAGRLVAETLNIAARRSRTMAARDDLWLACLTGAPADVATGVGSRGLSMSDTQVLEHARNYLAAIGPKGGSPAELGPEVKEILTRAYRAARFDGRELLDSRDIVKAFGWVAFGNVDQAAMQAWFVSATSPYLGGRLPGFTATHAVVGFSVGPDASAPVAVVDVDDMLRGGELTLTFENDVDPVIVKTPPLVPCDQVLLLRSGANEPSRVRLHVAL